MFIFGNYMIAAAPFLAKPRSLPFILKYNKQLVDR
jgi:hypothetical protein